MSGYEWDAGRTDCPYCEGTGTDRTMLGTIVDCPDCAGLGHVDENE